MGHHMLTRLRAFLADPFEPQNNVALFAAFDRWLPQPTECLPPEDPDRAFRMLLDLRASIEESFGRGWLWPEESAFKAAWPTLTPRARWLVLYHDGMHASLDVEQDVAGEYELAARLATMPARWFRGFSIPEANAGTLRAYGALALATLPVGMYRAGLAPLRGALAGLVGVRR